jgi:hypothetical protein
MITVEPLPLIAGKRNGLVGDLASVSNYDSSFERLKTTCKGLCHKRLVSPFATKGKRNGVKYDLEEIA